MLGHVIYHQDKQKGIEYFDELIKTGDHADTTYEWYGLSLFWDSDYPKAADVMLAGIEQYPKNQKLPTLLASVLQKQGKHIPTIEALHKNIDQNPKFADSYLTLTQILIDINMPKDAFNCCKIGMRQCPLDTSLIEKYVTILPEQDSAKKRMFAYLRLCKIKPDSYKYWTLLGNEYLKLDFHDKAIKAYHKGNILAEEKEAWIMANIGNIMNNQGFHSRGIEFLQQAVSIDPDSQYAHERLSQALKQASDQQTKCDEIRNEVNQSIQDGALLDPILEQVREKLSQQAATIDTLKTAIAP